MGILWSILAFIVAIGILVTVHEFGHYWVARRAGIKVLRFSVGFGRPLLRWRRGADRTEYVIAAIPLGGYVKMLDEREAEVPEAERHRAFNVQPLYKRTAVVLAGPLFNFLFAVLAYMAIGMLGTVEMRPVLGPVAQDTPAAEAGFQEGDELLAIDGRDTPTWQRTAMALVDAGFHRDDIPVEVRGEDGRARALVLDMTLAGDIGRADNLLALAGFRPWTPPLDPLLGHVVEDGPAARAGLVAGDRIVAVNGEPIDEWRALVEWIEQHPGETLTLTIEREGQRESVQARLDSVEAGGRTIGQLGVGPEVPEGAYERLYREVQYGPVGALGHGLASTWDASILTVKILGRMVIGQASLQNLSGPLTIGQFAGDTASLGVVPFLGFLAIVSISLGIINLLPIPILDGGHLLYFAVEAVRGKPLSEYAQAVGQQVGLLLLFLLMGLAFYNDLARLFGG